MKILAIFLLVVGTVAAADSQSGILMSKRNSKKRKFIPEDTRVYYKHTNSHDQNYHPDGKIEVKGIGILHVLSDSVIQVDSEIIRVYDLLRFGARKRGANVGANVLLSCGFVLVLAATHNENGQDKTDLAWGTIGLLMETVAIIDAINRKSKKVASWKFEVVR